MHIKKSEMKLIREPLTSPFGFKGDHIDELWQVIVRLETEDHTAVGLGVQSPLWSDAQVFAKNGSEGSNQVMYDMTEYALAMAKRVEFDTPMELIDDLLPRVLEFGKKRSGLTGMKTTFALNALVPLDFASWLLYARENRLTAFDQMIPSSVKDAMSCSQQYLGRIPLITYGLTEEGVKKIIGDGNFFLKIKIGSNPDGDNDGRKMLKWDKERLSMVHRLARDVPTKYTLSGHILYYLDANGRYASKEMVTDLLEHADRIGALNRIALLEEPFDENNEIDVSDLPVRVTADESAHSVEDVRKRIEMGYKAIALKPIAKTLSMTFKMLVAAQSCGISCFCADLTVNPLMVEWNKNVACRINVIPGLKVGVVESNGHQNYKNWSAMEKYHPCYGHPFTKISGSCYHLDKEFYQKSGGILMDSTYYDGLFQS